MEFRLRQFTWLIFFVSMCCGIYADNAYQPSSPQFYDNKNFQSGGETEQKSVLPTLDNVKSIQIQNGYSGILIPERTIDKAENFLEAVGVDKGILEYVKGLIPKTAKALVKFVFKFSAVAVTTVLVILTASSIATAFCSYTELCSLKFPELGLWPKDNLEESVRAFLSPEKMSSLSSFVFNAIHKYDNLNKKKFKSLKQ